MAAFAGNRMGNTNSGFYTVKFHDDRIQTVVTSSASVVDQWLLKIFRLHSHRLHKLIVGLDTEWKPNFNTESNNPIAIVQICVGHRCLIFQILKADAVPASLVRFLGNDSVTFVGVGVEEDAQKLMEHHGLRVSRTLNVADVAAAKYNNAGLKRLGLKRLAFELTKKWMQKPKKITLSNWDAEWLSFEQIEYASIDAYVSFLLGLVVLKNNNQPSPDYTPLMMITWGSAIAARHSQPPRFSSIQVPTGYYPLLAQRGCKKIVL